MKAICLSIVLLAALSLPSLGEWSASPNVIPGRKTSAFKDLTCRDKSGTTLQIVTRSTGTAEAAMISADGRFLGVFAGDLFVLYGEDCAPTWERRNVDHRGGAISDVGDRIMLPFSLPAEGFEDMPHVRNRWIEILETKGSLVWKVEHSSGFGNGFGFSKNGRFAYIKNFTVRHVNEPYSKEHKFQSLNIDRQITSTFTTGLIADTAVADFEISDGGQLKVWENGKLVYQSSH